jgi:protein-L-isoaspartate(D-aspartate) O-methyltransferase
MSFESARFNMIEQQIRPWNVLDQQVLSLFGRLHREDFVPPGNPGLAFMDIEVPLAATHEAATAAGQFMLCPKVEGRFMQELAVKSTDRVLEIGTGSGFMAALLGSMAASVLTLEKDAALADAARANLIRAGLGNVTVQVADGALGAAVQGPFDIIVLSGSVAHVPDDLLRQLTVGGRLMGVVGQQPIMRATVIERTGEATFTSREAFDTVAPRLSGFAEPSRFAF